MDMDSMIMGQPADRLSKNNEMDSTRMTGTTNFDKNESSSLTNLSTEDILKLAQNYTATYGFIVTEAPQNPYMMRMISSGNITRDNSSQPNIPSRIKISDSGDDGFLDNLLERIKADMATQPDENKKPRKTTSYKRKSLFNEESLNLMKRFKDGLKNEKSAANAASSSSERSAFQKNNIELSEVNPTVSTKYSKAFLPRYMASRDNPYSDSSLCSLRYTPVNTVANSNTSAHQSKQTRNNSRAALSRYRSAYGNCYPDSSVSYPVKPDVTLKRQLLGHSGDGGVAKTSKLKFFTLKSNSRKHLHDATNNSRVQMMEECWNDSLNKYSGRKHLSAVTNNTRLPSIEECYKDGTSSSSTPRSNNAFLLASPSRMKSHYFTPIAQDVSLSDNGNERSIMSMEGSATSRGSGDSVHGMNFEYVISKTEILEISEVNDHLSKIGKSRFN